MCQETMNHAENRGISDAKRQALRGIKTNLKGMCARNLRPTTQGKDRLKKLTEQAALEKSTDIRANPVAGQLASLGKNLFESHALKWLIVVRFIEANRLALSGRGELPVGIKGSSKCSSTVAWHSGRSREYDPPR